MALVAEIYGLTVNEATSLTDAETKYLLAQAQQKLLQSAITDSLLMLRGPDVQKMLRPQLQSALKTIKKR